MKICPARGELFHADKRTDMTELIVTFRRLAKAPTYAFSHNLFMLSVRYSNWIANISLL